MNTKTKSTLGAIVLAVAGVLVSVYVPDDATKANLLSVIGLAVGWLGFAKPGQGK